MSKRNKSRKKNYSHTEAIRPITGYDDYGRPIVGPRTGSRDVNGRGETMLTRYYQH